MSPVGKRKSSSGSYELSLYDARKVCVFVCVCVFARACVRGSCMFELKPALLLIVMVRIMKMMRIH